MEKKQMASRTLDKLKLSAAKLPDVLQKILLATAEAMQGSGGNDDDDAVEAPKRGRPRNSEKSGVNKSAAKSEKRGRGRPRKTADEDEELQRPARKSGKSAKAAKPAKKSAAKPAAKKSAESVDISDMSKSEIRALAETWKIENSKLLRDQTKLARVLTGIQKIANGSRDVADVEKMAKRAKVELVFGKGRPPVTDEGLKRRILVKMANEGAYNG
jgi:hypothetical protein